MLLDEILYHARVHPEERCNVLTDEQLEALHKQTSEVCQFAVSVNADDSKFPEDWLFKHRWVCPPLHFSYRLTSLTRQRSDHRERGRKRNIHSNWYASTSPPRLRPCVLTHTQSDGRPATIKWITVGGRTSAYVSGLQQLKRGATSIGEVSSTPVVCTAH